MTFEIKDSGERQEFSTGSRRDSQKGKGRFDLISPVALLRLAQHYEGGAEKYDARNWEKGQPLTRFLSSALSHLNKYKLGYRDEDHMTAAAWNIFGFIHVEDQIKRGLLPAELNDLPASYVAEYPPLATREQVRAAFLGPTERELLPTEVPVEESDR